MEGVDMSRRRRLIRTVTIAALGLGLAAPVAEARPIDVKDHGWTTAAAVTVGTSHHASTQSLGSVAPILRAKLQQNNELSSTGQVSTGRLEQSPKESVNWTTVALATGLSIFVVGAFGIGAYRVRTRHPAPAA
jgi:hypothetical protein